MSTRAEEMIDSPKRRGSNLDLAAFYNNVNFNDHLPNFVKRSKNVELRSIGFKCSAEEGKQLFTFHIRWTDPSSDAEETWEAIAKSIKNQTAASASLTDLFQCDGPCKMFHHYRKMMKYPDCCHIICAKCRYEQISVPNADGTPGCCVEKCYRESLINRVPSAEYRQEAMQKSNPFIAITYSPNTSQKTSHGISNTSFKKKCHSTNFSVPTELLQICVVILEKSGGTIIRNKLEFELPSDFSISYILDVVEEKIQRLDGIHVYYTTKPIRSKKDLIPITISPEDERTFASVAEGRSMINFVVTTKGIRMFGEKSTEREAQQPRKSIKCGSS